MSRFSINLILGLVVLTLVLCPGSVCAGHQYAVGYVFHDRNGNGERDPGEEGIPGVKVSNGRLVVKTDEEGRYRLPVDDDTIIFITKPRNWMTPVCENNIPRFYYVHKPKGSPQMRYKGVDPTGPLPESVDFPLHPSEEPDKFKVIVFGDTQPRNKEQVFFLGHDIIRELAGVDAAFATTLGDVVDDHLNLFEDLIASKGLIGVPWYYVKGNHDSNYDGAPNHHMTSETWARLFGPPYYSFEYGPVHFIALNNAYFGQPRDYRNRLDPRQLMWLSRDVSLVPEDKLIVLLMHIPIHWMEDRAQVFRTFQHRKHTFSLAAHTHTQYHVFCNDEQGWHGEQPHHHLVHAAACGSWWQGALDELGVPHSLARDGTPNGYSIITFDGNEYSVRYKVARRPADYQMNIWAPDEVARDEAEPVEVLVNVFTGSFVCQPEMRVGDGPWVSMVREGRQDPYLRRAKDFEDSLERPIPWRATGVENSHHIWKAGLPSNLSEGAHLIHIRTTDPFGRTHEGYRVIHVK